MDWHDAALVIAGLIGSCTAVFHGMLVQRLMVRPIAAALAHQKTSATIRRLIAPLLHFSTYGWFLGGVALVVVAISGSGEAKIATGVFVGSLYLFGAIANAWGSRGRHPGWLLMAAAVILIVIGLARFS
jgi:hypothetical protein